MTSEIESEFELINLLNDTDDDDNLRLLNDEFELDDDDEE